ncbi:MAG: hypothetical protein JWM18_741 [Chloroflexi bacterium]|nr:hypothetical protein [Chloroflexota bacterium]
MPETQDLATQPWLCGLIACALRREAFAVRAELGARRLRWSSVPAGRAGEAWTCATGSGTLAVVVSGPGAEQARQAASFWMPRARQLVVLGAGPATGLVRPPAVVLDGDPRLRLRARDGGAAGVEVVEGRVGQVEMPIRSAQAWESLAGAGYATVSAELDPWREAARAVGGTVLVCLGVHEQLEAPERVLAAAHRDDRGWARVGSAVQPGIRRVREAAAGVTDAAARCAVAAVLGPA